jgi:hypothetical protein
MTPLLLSPVTDARYSRGIVFWGGPLVETNGTKEEEGGWGSDPEEEERKE